VSIVLWFQLAECTVVDSNHVDKFDFRYAICGRSFVGYGN